jgi:hypothetical protein
MSPFFIKERPLDSSRSASDVMVLVEIKRAKIIRKKTRAARDKIVHFDRHLLLIKDLDLQRVSDFKQKMM